MGDYGIKASKDGEDVFTATDKNLAFTSKAISPKIKASGTLTFTASPETQTVAHGLAYIPQILLFLKASGDSFWTFLATGHYVDATNVSVTRNNGDQVRYYILYNPLADSFTGTSQGTNNIGMKVSESGESPFTTNFEDLIYTSELESIMIQATFDETLSVTTDDLTDYTSTDAHGIGYTPAFLTTVKFNTGAADYNYPYQYITGDPAPTDVIYSTIDGTNITYHGAMSSFGAPLTVYFRTHIFNLEIE